MLTVVSDLKSVSMQIHSKPAEGDSGQELVEPKPPERGSVRNGWL